jgi:small multidrug resistance family-3 protein
MADGRIFTSTEWRPMMEVARSIALFVAAGLAEIGGGYLVWLWLRENKSFLLALVAVPILFSYGVLPTLQTQHFGRVYAAYGGIFVVMALLWSWTVDGRRPDTFDVIGAGVVIAGVSLIMWGPRS